MKKNLLLAALAVVTVLSSCKKSDDESAAVIPADPYSNNNTSYETAFKNSAGESTVDRKDGRLRLLMLKALDSTAKLPNSSNTTVLSSTTLSNLYSNTGSPFGNPGLNTATVSLKDATARSASDPSAIRAHIESYFPIIASASVTAADNYANDAVNKDTARVSVAGRLYSPGATSKYLVDAMGLEYAQVISKSLIGSLQLDYICNVLLSDNSLTNADNVVLINNKYTALQHRWDEAYGFLTLKDRYAQDATETTNGGESFLGSYIWEYNKEAYPLIHVAFLKGRKAAVDNDRAAAKEQAQFIRRELEKAIAKAALGYMGKYKSGTSNAQRAHAIGEGYGFIYSLRFCKYHGADAAFSDAVLSNLINGNGFWSLSTSKVDVASASISARFGL